MRIHFLSYKVVSLRADTIVSTCRDLCLYVQIQLPQRVETLHIRLSVLRRLCSLMFLVDYISSYF